MVRLRSAGLAACMSTVVAAAACAEDARLRNWFNDPWFVLSHALPGCPAPAGPLLSEAEMKAEAHSRAERGTSCWMSGECREPNAYRYDAAIARAVQQRLHAHPALHGTSLWVMVQRRFVWLQGCAADMAQVAALEGMLRDIPDVERVLVDVMTGTRGKPPYRVLPQGAQ